MTTRIAVSGESPYDVVVGAGVLEELPSLVDAAAAQVLLVHSHSMSDLASRVETALRDGDVEVVRAPVPDGEAAKTVEVADDLWSLLGRHAFTRSVVVVSLGGGAVLDPGNRNQLAGRTVVFLDVSITDAAKRIGFNRDRPLLLGNPRAQWVRLMEARRPLYEQVASFTVSTDGKSPDEVADEVVARVSS